MTSGAFSTLVRHFAGAILSPSILSDLGVDYLRRTLFSVLAVFIVLGSFLPRVFFKKYTDMGALVGVEVYQRAVLADTLLMIAIPMVIIGIGAVILGPLLFPDETDYRVLTPLPITRAELFGAKLCALCAIALTGVIAVNMVASFWFPIAVGGQKAAHPLLPRVGAHAVATVAGSIWMFLAVMALQGLATVAVPVGWQRRLGQALQASLFVGLLWSLPLVIQIPAMDVSAARVMQAPLVWLPPTWFFGLEQWLLGGPAAGGYVAAARMAGWAFLFVAAAVIAAYAILYRTAERLAGVSGAGRRRPVRGFQTGAWLERIARLPPATAAVVSFVSKGLARSRLHQFVFLLIVGGGVALVIGEVLTVTTATEGRMSHPRAAVNAAIAAPLLVALVTTLALRAAFLWPLDRDAAWVFRLTEDPHSRADALDGVLAAFIAGVTITPWIVGAALQPAVLGGSSWACMIVTTLAGLMVVEFVLIDWRRIPFACGYLPGKKNLAYTLGVLFASYVFFVVIGSNLIRWAIVDVARTVAMAGWLLAGWAALRRARVRTWGALPLEFEDEDPHAVRTLGLGVDER